MGNVTEVKNKIEEQVLGKPWIGLVAVLAVSVLEIIVGSIGNLFGYGGFFYFLLKIIALLISLVRNIAIVYVSYMLIVRKNLLQMEAKITPFLFIAACFILHVVTSIVIDLILGYQIFYFQYFVSLFTEFIGIGIFSAIGNLFNLFSYFSYHGFIAILFLIISTLLQIVIILIRLAMVVLLLVYALKRAGAIQKCILEEQIKMLVDGDEAVNANADVEADAKENVVPVEPAVAEEGAPKESSTEEKTSQEIPKVDKDLANLFCATNNKYFGPERMSMVRQRLMSMPAGYYASVLTKDYQDPTVIFLVSLSLGTFGIDRFMIGDIGMGVLKLLTGGCCGILTIVDWFIIRNKTKENNFKKFMS